MLIFRNRMAQQKQQILLFGLIDPLHLLREEYQTIYEFAGVLLKP